MAWPQDPPLTKANLDADGDNPLLARAELESLLDRVNLILLEAANGSQMLTDQNAVANNVALTSVSNLFSLLQTIQVNGKQLRLDLNSPTVTGTALEISRQTTQQWLFDLIATTNALNLKRADNSVVLDIAQDALTLALGANGVTYGGQAIGTKVYEGFVDSTTPASSRLPGGWNLFESTEYWEITHSLGHTNYSVGGCAVTGPSSLTYSLQARNITNDYARISISRADNITMGTDFSFIIVDGS